MLLRLVACFASLTDASTASAPLFDRKLSMDFGVINLNYLRALLPDQILLY